MKKGSTVILYKDYQNNKDPMGVAILVKHIRNGYPFILDEDFETTQETFIPKYWEVEWVEKYIDTINPERNIFPIRTLDTVGLTTTSSVESGLYTDYHYLIDSFIKINGIEIF
jgi:hypothetical protein